jgi:16S rRNA (cytosine1402-N4)-methyltransferase
VRARQSAPLRSTAELATLVSGAVPSREPGRHPATRTFQALRMHVNQELEQLDQGLSQALALLAPAGRLVVISFHSLEDRAVKQFIRRHSEGDAALAGVPLRASELAAAQPLALARVGRKQRPSAAELAANPRARSAMLRVAERLA